MKKQLLVGSAMLVAVGAFAQGTVLFNNAVTGVVRAPVYGNEVGNPNALKTGNRASDTPPGTQTYTGTLLSGGAGSTWIAQLYGGPLGTADGSLTPLLLTTTFRTGTAAGFVNQVTVTVPGVPAGTAARIQMRAFDNATGATYETALNRGASLSFDSPPLGGLLALPANLVGLTGFNVAVVPEPSTIALGVLGAIFFLIRRRK